MGDEEWLVRSLELSLKTFHILPRGYFLVLILAGTVNFEQDLDHTSLGIALGKALNRRLSLQAGYVQYAAGQKTYNRGFTAGLTWIFGREKGRP